MSDFPALPIGALARRTHCPVATIRYYEEIGLLPPPVRAANGHRYYRERDVTRLAFIKRCRDFGFALEQVRPLLALFEHGERNCNEARDLARHHLLEIQLRLTAMRQLESTLAAFVADCEQECAGGPARDCVILDGMSAGPTTVTGCCAKVGSHLQQAEG